MLSDENVKTEVKNKMDPEEWLPDDPSPWPP